jgi:hypothetical protein
MTAIADLEINRADQSVLLHSVLNSAANDFYFADVSKRDHLPILGEAFYMRENIFETHELQQQVRQNLIIRKHFDIAWTCLALFPFF